MKPHIAKIIGKTIVNVVVAEADRNPKQQVYLVFTDGTHFELYGGWFTCANHIQPGDVTNLLDYMKNYERTKIRVFPENEE